MDALNVENICVKAGGRHLVENVTFSVEKGRIVAIIGPNGAGKTTLIKAILGLIPCETGSVAIFGKSFRGNNSQIQVGYVPQNFEFDRTFPLTVAELLGFSMPPAYSFLFAGTSAKSRINELLDVVGAGELSERVIGSLSGGELQRIMVAKAIAKNPGILFLDEPASGVDIKGQEKFHDLIRRLNKEKGMTVVMISHDLNVVYRFADDVLCLNRRLVCSGKPEETLTDDVIKSVYGEMMGAYIHSCHEHD